MCGSTILPGSYTQGSDAGTLVCSHHAAVPSHPSPREYRAAGEATECQPQEVSSLSGLVISSAPHYSSEASDMEGTKVRSVKKAPPPPPPPRQSHVPAQTAVESGPGDAPEAAETPGGAVVSLPVPAPRRRSSCSVTPVPAPRTRSSQQAAAAAAAAAGEHCGSHVGRKLLPLFGSTNKVLIFLCVLSFRWFLGTGSSSSESAGLPAPCHM